MKPGIFCAKWVWLMVISGGLTLTALIAPKPAREDVFAADELRIINPNSVVWTEADKSVRCGRNDPHFELALPCWAQAVTEVTLVVEPIWGNVGVFQFYYIPNRSVEPFFTADWRVDIMAEIYGGPYHLKVMLPETATRIRIDPPDGAQFVLKSVVVRSHPGQVPVVRRTLLWLMVFFWVATLLTGFWAQCRSGLRWLGRTPRLLIVATLVFLVLARIWLTAGQPLRAVGGAMHDDQLFIEQAASIVAGNWLGEYNNLTLVKGQGYPLWIAAMFFLHLPLVFSHHLLYVAAAVLGYFAWRPMLPRLGRLAVVAVLLFNPASFHGDDAARILRNHFCASLALLAFVCVTGWFLRWRGSIREQIGWAAGMGAAFSTLWLTREETIWMSGVIGLVGLAGVWSVRRGSGQVWRRISLVALVPVAVWAGAVTTMCALNFSHYGFWGTVEFRSAAFQDAYGALSRITVGPWRQYVPVSQEARAAAYRVSPAFAQMQPFLEGELGEGWASLGEWQIGLPSRQRQIHGAGFMWALRDGAAAASQHTNCRQALAYYRRVADEINVACDEGRLPSLARRSGFVPPWRPEYTEQIPGFYFEAWKFITTFAYVVPRPPPSSGEETQLAVYRRMTHTPLSPRSGEPPLAPDGLRREAFTNGVLKDVTRIYSWITPFAVISAVPMLIWLWLRVGCGRARAEIAVVATAALAGAVAITLIVTLIHVTSFVGITIGYQAAAYPLVLAFASLTHVAALQELEAPAGGGFEL